MKKQLAVVSACSREWAGSSIGLLKTWLEGIDLVAHHGDAFDNTFPNKIVEDKMLGAAVVPHA